MQLCDVKFACLDTETTGLSPQEGGKICEIAVSVTQNGRPLETFTTLINPGCPMHPDVIAIHGITNEMVKTAPSFAQIAPQLLTLLDGCVLVAHNAKFDLSFLQAECENCGLSLGQRPVLDTLLLARKSGLFQRNNLGFVAQQLGIDARGCHRAMADTKMAEQVLYYFMKHLATQGVSTLDDLMQFQHKRWPAPGRLGKENSHE